MSSSFMSIFSVEPQTLAILASLESQLIEVDTSEGLDSPDWVPLTPADGIELKDLWLVEWESNVNQALFLMDSQHSAKIWNDRDSEFLPNIKRLKEPLCRNLANLILIELSAFQAYWPRKKGETKFRGLFFSDGPLERFLEKTSKSFNLPDSTGRQFREKMKSIQHDLFYSGKIPPTTEFQDWRLGGLGVGISYPFWDGLFEPGRMPENEAVIFRGISSLGTGITLFRKFDPSKKNEVLAGGGGLITLGQERTFPRDFFRNPELISVSAAKLEVMIQEVILQNPAGKEILKDILTSLGQVIQFLTSQCESFRNSVNLLTISQERLKAKLRG
ncbi:hypothetical protein HYY75_08765 [bacterium]|nr:hypothetical protein [bacterium]